MKFPLLFGCALVSVGLCGGCGHAGGREITLSLECDPAHPGAYYYLVGWEEWKLSEENKLVGNSKRLHELAREEGPCPLTVQVPEFEYVLIAKSKDQWSVDRVLPDADHNAPWVPKNYRPEKEWKPE